MFEKKDVIEFLTRIIQKSNRKNAEDTKQSILKYKEYLELTTMCDEETISSIANVSECVEELITIKEKTGICDIKPMFNQDTAKEEKQETIKVKQIKYEEPYQQKHYDRYAPTSYDTYSGCGSSHYLGPGAYGSSC